MPFLTFYSERKMLAELGYNCSWHDLDAATATCLIIIKSELTKQENEAREKSAKKGRAKRGR